MNIFLDIDGVMSNWNEHALFTIKKEMTPSIRKWILEGKLINKHPDIDEANLFGEIEKIGVNWWANIPLLPWADQLYKMTRSHGDLYFLSSPCRGSSSFSGKAEWVKKNFPKSKDNIIITKHKHLCASYDSVLIDDRQENVDSFIRYGGYAYLFPCHLAINNSKKQKDILSDIDLTLKLAKTA
jgi:5'(3')-deoxyribonucleotidase